MCDGERTVCDGKKGEGETVCDETVCDCVTDTESVCVCVCVCVCVSVCVCLAIMWCVCVCVGLLMTCGFDRVGMCVCVCVCVREKRKGEWAREGGGVSLGTIAVVQSLLLLCLALRVTV